MRIQEFLKNEKEYYGKIFVDINYGIDNITHFISEEELARRKYTSRLPVLKKYIDAIEGVEKEAGKGGFLGMFNNDKYTDLLNGYKKDHREELAQLEKCSNCKCLNCTMECKFESCGGCRDSAEVVSCDHKKINVVFYDSLLIDLTNDRTGKDEKYKVLAITENIERDRKYIVIEGIHTREKFILYYFPGISEDSYGEITDEKEFAEIVSAYESVERD
jgi:hypothetical protein